MVTAAVRRPRRLTWQDEVKLAVLRRVIRAEKKLHCFVRWAAPIRDYLLWTPIVASVAGLLLGVCLRLLLP